MPIIHEASQVIEAFCNSFPEVSIGLKSKPDKKLKEKKITPITLTNSMELG